MNNTFLVKQQAFENYLRPLLNNKLLDRNSLQYFYEQGFRCWIFNFKNNDISKVKKIEKICKNLFELNKDLALNIFLEIIENLNDNREILERELSKKEKTFEDLFNLYKALYENELKIWSTPLYAFICEKYKGNKINGTKIKKLPLGRNYLNVATGSKIFYINNGKYGFPDLVEGIDKIIRNAGAGHNSYEILDDGKYRLKDINPNTGEEKNVLEITKEELQEKVKEFEKLLLIYDLGFHIFIENNIMVKNYILKNKKKKIKISEIEKNIRLFADDFQLEILKFNFSLDRKKLILSIKNKIILTGIGVGHFYTPNGGGDIITKKRKVKYIDNIFDLIISILYFNNNKPFKLELEYFNSNKEKLYEGTFNEKEIVKLINENKKIYPIPEKGNLPNDKYELKVELKVPYGAGKEMDLVVNNPLFNENTYLKTLVKYM